MVVLYKKWKGIFCCWRRVWWWGSGESPTFLTACSCCYLSWGLVKPCDPPLMEWPLTCAFSTCKSKAPHPATHPVKNKQTSVNDLMTTAVRGSNLIYYAVRALSACLSSCFSTTFLLMIPCPHLQQFPIKIRPHNGAGDKALTRMELRHLRKD